MSEYPNSGILFPNQYHRTGGNMPSQKGSARTTCLHCGAETEFEVVAWDKKKSKSFLALKFTEKGEAERKKTEAQARKSGLPVDGATPPTTAGARKPPPEEDDVPF